MSNTFLHARSMPTGGITPEDIDFMKKLVYKGMEIYSPYTGRKDKIDRVYTHLVRTKRGECIPWGMLVIAYREGGNHG